ncbi:hypothetical protein KAR10_00320 [bacterium]|nr:hypothetical protein [bacterium]
MDLKNGWQIGIVLVVSLLVGMTGCGKKSKIEKSKIRWDAGLEAEVQKAKDADLKNIMAEIELTKTPYKKGNLTPELAAEITHHVGRRSLHEIPVVKELPDDPKEIMALNKRIREKTDKIYAAHGTTQGNIMRYISDMSDAERERYDKKLTELFLETSRKKYNNKKPKEAAPKAAPGKKK